MSSFCPNNLSEMTTCFDSKSSCSITVNRVLSCKIFDLLSPPIFGIKLLLLLLKWIWRSKKKMKFFSFVVVVVLAVLAVFLFDRANGKCENVTTTIIGKIIWTILVARLTDQLLTTPETQPHLKNLVLCKYATLK